MSIDHPRPSRSELAIVILIVAVGFALRCAFPNRIAVEHFDEGVYASTSNLHYFYSISDDFEYPNRHLYAPPLFPWLVHWSIDLIGPASYSPMIVNMLAGGLTVILVWWVGRSWFGSTAGLSAATLASLSDIHLIYSRTALTDVLLSFWMLLAVWLIWNALRTGRGLTIVAAGVVTGLAWWTKYNGWLPLAIGAAGLVPWLLLKAKGRSHTWRFLFRWLLIAAIAFAVFSPMLVWLAPRGGYTSVAQNHYKYLVGLSGWFRSFRQQWSSHEQFSGWLSCASLALACVLPAISARAQSSETIATKAARSPRLLVASSLTGLFLFASACGFGSSVVLAVLAVVGVVINSGPLQSKNTSSIGDAQSLAAWLLAAWFLGLTLTIPFYHPYLRLTLPWLLATWLATGAAIAWFCSRFFETSLTSSRNAVNEDDQRHGSWTTRTKVAALLAIAVMLWNGPEVTSRGIPAWQPRTDFVAIAHDVVKEARRLAANEQPSQIDGVDLVLYVFGEPGLFFHLPDSGVIVQPVPNLDFVHPNAPRQRAPTFLVSGLHAHLGDSRFETQLHNYSEQFRLVGRFAYDPSYLVRLNLYGPGRRGHPSEEEIRLYLATQVQNPEAR